MKHATEEERLEAIRESKRKYNKSTKGRKAMKDWYSENKDSKEFKEERNSRQREYRANQPEEVKKVYKERHNASAQASRREDPVRHMLYDAKKRAKRKGLEFDLVAEDIVVPDYCPVLGIELFFGEGFRTQHSPSLDRFDNCLGYTKDNVRVISYRANSLKNDATLVELQKIVAYMGGA